MRATTSRHSYLALTCPRCSATFEDAQANQPSISCPCCQQVYTSSGVYLDLLGGDGPVDQTDEHYTYQWGREKGFFHFMRTHPGVKKITPGGQLGWNDLLEEIRRRCQEADERTYVYDAACGFGGIAMELATPSTKDHLCNVGADIHHSLPDLLAEWPLLSSCGHLLRWDISRPLPVQERFDYVICRASIHHTPDPRATFASLCSRLKPGGQIAITVYRKKGQAREALDDTFRSLITQMPIREAYATARQFTLLGKSLQQIDQTVTIDEDLPLFGIKKGTYAVQALFYNHFLKCFFNPVFGDEYSTLVNYDWYHPPFAYRYDADEVLAWFAAEDLQVIRTEAIEAQYYFLGKKRG